MVSESAQKHDADQAGGEKEVVYSSDGADSVKVTFPHTVTSSAFQDTVGTSSGNDGGDALITEGLNPELAFEVFSGKIFPVNKYKKGSSTFSSVSAESPLQRLSRIQQELNELQEFVSTSVTIPGIDNEKNAFGNQVGTLREQWSLISDAQSKQHENLLATIGSSIAGLSSAQVMVHPKATGAAPVTPMPILEERLKKLELAIGAGAVSNGSVVGRLQKLENLQSKLDEKQADQLQKRAKVIRQDLEAAAKARNKLMTAGSGGSIVGAEDSKTIAALYDQLQSLSGMSEHLPVLAQRLQVLSQQHTSAASWDLRLRATESLASNIETHFSAVEGAIRNMEIALQKNALQMQTNVTALDERLDKLMKK